MDFLVVNLHVGDLHLAAVVVGCDVSDGGEHVATQPRDDAGRVGRAHHGVRLARACLAVGEDAAVVTLEGIL